MGHIRQRSPDAELFLSPANTKGEMFGRKSKLELLVDDFQPSNHLIHRNLLPIGHDTEIDEQEDEYTLMPEDQELGKGREQTYEQVLALRELQKLPRNRVAIECIVAIDVKTNIVISDEYSFITGLSAYLAELYQRPESSIVVTLQHTSCLLFSGSFDPAYIMTVSSIRRHLEEALHNKKAAALQVHMQESVGVLPERGLVKFEIISENNIATNGKTLRLEIADLEMKMDTEFANKTYATSTSRIKAGQNVNATRSFKATTSLPAHHEMIVTPPESEDGAPPPPPISREKSHDHRMPAIAERIGRRKSFSAWMFGKGGRHE